MHCPKHWWLHPRTEKMHASWAKKTLRHTAKKGDGYEQGCYVKGGFHGQCLALKNMEILDGI
jgi:hypothetical protein